MDAAWVFFFMIGLPAVAIAIGTIGQEWFKHQNKKLELHSKETAEKAAQYAAQTERLEQRMRILERIITDKGFDVSTQIEGLRNENRKEELN